MSQILLNSGGGIHVDNGVIVLVPAGKEPSDCLCCGPPQPPPPECTTCYFGLDPETGLPIYGPPIKKDFAVEITVTDSQTFTRQAWYEHNTRLDNFTCEQYRFDYEEVIQISGLSALNGTYFGIDGGVSHTPFSPTCGGPSSPEDLDVAASCAEECNYSCRKDVWILDVPITGNYSCFSAFTGVRSNGITNSGYTNFSIPLTGYAWIIPTPINIEYEFGGPGWVGNPPFNIGTILTGTAIDGYGITRHVNLTWGIGGFNNWWWTAPSDPCGVDRITASNIWRYVCRGSSTPENLSCYPYWRQPYRAAGGTCALEPGSYSKINNIVVPACEGINEYDDQTLVDPGCGQIYFKGYHRRARTAWEGNLELLWSDV